MKISTKGRYALRLMADLAQRPESPVPIKEIALSQNLSHKYLEQIIMQLSKANLVKGVRGPQGGYLLALDPTLITAGMILRTMEGNLSVAPCLELSSNECDQTETCVAHSLYAQLKEAIDSIVDRVTLADLIKQQG